MTPRTVTTTSVAVLGGLAVLAVWGPSAFLAVLLVGLALGIVHHELTLLPPGQQRPDEDQPPPPSTAVLLLGGPTGLPLTGWSDAELCRAWRVTYAQLQQHRGPAWAEHLAEQRRTYLDELQHRDPTGFAAWIASGARAASDPARYLTATRPLAP